MVAGTVWELIALWVLICGIAAIFGARNIVIVFHIIIIILIIAGFFMGIGNQLLLYML